MLDDLAMSYMSQSAKIMNRLPQVTEVERRILARNKKFIKVIWRYK